jgi:hypothetical protein
MSACVYVYMCVCAYVRMCVCVYVYVGPRAPHQLGSCPGRVALLAARLVLVPLPVHILPATRGGAAGSGEGA